MPAPLRPRLLCVALLCALAPAAIGGCGGSGGSGSKSDFIAKANKICEASNKDLNKISAQLRGIGRTVRNKKDLYSRAAQLTHQAAVRESAATGQLASLAAPSNDRASIDTWIGQLRQQASLTEVAVGSFNSHSSKGANDAVSKILPLQAQAHAFANRYGMRSCGVATHP